MRTIGVVTVARSDFFLYLPLIRRLQQFDSVETKVYVSGTHLSPDFGLTVQDIEAAGIEIAERIPSLVPSDTPAAIGQSMALGLSGFSELFGSRPPDLLVVLGDRFDMYPAALAALAHCIPVAHISGGDVTEGAIDDALRHSLTKLSHLHFPSTSEYGRRIERMGEAPWRVMVVGALGIDAINDTAGAGRAEIASAFGLDAERRYALVTFHPVTLEVESTEIYVRNLLAALDAADLQCVFTYPNADPGGRLVIRMLTEFCSQRTDAHMVMNARDQYFDLMRHAAVMIGNSSSGIVEALSFELPVVNIGTRQTGRVRGPNVIDCGYDAEAISAGITRALDPSFRKALRGVSNPYGEGRAAELIASRLRDVDLDEHLLRKQFYDQPV